MQRSRALAAVRCGSPPPCPRLHRSLRLTASDSLTDAGMSLLTAAQQPSVQCYLLRRRSSLIALCPRRLCCLRRPTKPMLPHLALRINDALRLRSA